MYSVVKFKIDNGLDNQEIALEAGDYIILQYSPVEVQMRLELTTNPAITLMQNGGIDTVNTNKVYVSCKAVKGGEITFLQSNKSKGFTYIAPTLSKVDVGTVDSVSNVENVDIVDIVNRVNNVEKILNCGGNGELTFQKLIENYGVVGSEADDVGLDNDDEISINDIILFIEQRINPNLTEIDWTMFEYIYVDASIEIRTDINAPYNIDDNYAAVTLSTSESNNVNLHAIDFIDNNRNGGKQVMNKTFSSNYLQKLTAMDSSGESLVYWNYNPEQNPIGMLWVAVVLFKTVLDITDTFLIGTEFVIDIGIQKNIPFSIEPTGIDNWVGFAAVTVSFEINGTVFTQSAIIDGKSFYASKNINIADIGGTEVNDIDISYDSNPGEIRIWAYGSGGDGKVYLNNLTITVNGYL
ncbi:MAG: hypothetical protein LBI78_02165 [Campylobacteraceae bacterium]|jgi:hypothetical protein|nr:hypothetical protein [Campylobacteraceae bacterium]